MSTETHTPLPPTDSGYHPVPDEPPPRGSGLNAAAPSGGWQSTDPDDDRRHYQRRHGDGRREEDEPPSLWSTALPRSMNPADWIRLFTQLGFAGLVAALFWNKNKLDEMRADKQDARIEAFTKVITEQAKEDRKEAAADRREYMADGRANRESLNAAIQRLDKATAAVEESARTNKAVQRAVESQAKPGSGDGPDSSAPECRLFTDPRG